LTVAKTSGLETALNAKSPLDVQATSDAINSQPWCMAKISAWNSSSSVPLRGMLIGDSLSDTGGNFGLGPFMASAGVIGLQTFNTSGTVTNHTLPNSGRPDIWINGRGTTFAIGSSAEFTLVGAANGNVRGDRACIGYIAGPGKGAFDLQYQANGAGAWTTLANINTANASTIGVWATYNLPLTNFPFYRLRVTNVTTGIVELAPLTGIYNSTGGGVILMPCGMSSGLDLATHVASTPDAVFTPLWTGLSPDYVVSIWADAGSEWESGGAFRTFYARANAAKSQTDWIQISRNPSYEAYLSGYPSWVTATAYTAGQFVLHEVSGGVFKNYQCLVNHTSGVSTVPGTGASWATVWSEYYSPSAEVASVAVANAQAAAQRAWALSTRHTFLNGHEIHGGSYSVANGRGLMNDLVHLSPAGATHRNATLWPKLPLGQTFLGGGLKTGQNVNVMGQNLSASNMFTQPISFSQPIEMIGTGGEYRLADQAAPLDGARIGRVFNTSRGLNFLMGTTPLLTLSGAIDGTAGMYPGFNNLPLGSNLLRYSATLSGLNTGITTKTSAYTATSSDHTILGDATSGAFDITLPAAASHPGRIYNIKKTDASGNAVSINPNGSELIDGSSTSLAIGTQWAGKTIQSNGTSWFVIGSF
jgi:hypothetical protein